MCYAYEYKNKKVDMMTVSVNMTGIAGMILLLIMFMTMIRTWLWFCLQSDADKQYD